MPAQQIVWDLTPDGSAAGGPVRITTHARNAAEMIANGKGRYCTELPADIVPGVSDARRVDAERKVIVKRAAEHAAEEKLYAAARLRRETAQILPKGPQPLKAYQKGTKK